MTGYSIAIIIGYYLAHVLGIYLMDKSLQLSFPHSARWNIARKIFAPLYIVLFTLPVLGTFLPEGSLQFFCSAVGNVFMGFDLYIQGTFLVACLLVFLVRFPRRIAGRKKPDAPKIALVPRPWVLLTIALIVVPVVLYGMVHAQYPIVHAYENTVRATKEEGRHIRIALLADLHLSVNSSTETTKRIVDLCNEQNPDVVLVAGDIFTSTYYGLQDPEEHSAQLSRLEAPLGVYAVGGNHDVVEKLFCGFAVSGPENAFRPQEMNDFFEACGFTMIEDKVVSLGDGIVLAGRKDSEKDGNGVSHRMEASELLADTDEAELLLVVEHEPEDYYNLSEAGADAVFSGHTHNGQIFPGNILSAADSENGWGYTRIYDMDTYVTAGCGTFGPPVRLGTDSEIVIVDMYY